MSTVFFSAEQHPAQVDGRRSPVPQERQAVVLFADV